MSTISSIASFFCPTTIHLGNGASRRLPSILEQCQATRLFILVDPAVQSTPFMDSVLDELRQADVQTKVFSDIEEDPSVSTVELVVALAESFAPQALLAVGGGSTIDVAKALGIVMTNGGHIQDYEGIEQFVKPALPLIAIATTAGTGSEVSGSCVITDTQRNRKMSIRHARLNPARHAILDPQALLTLPPQVAAHAGLDAFVHALESYTSKQSNLFTDALNIQALTLISDSLRAFVADRSNPEIGLKMLTGSALTGMVFGQTGLGNVHCMARFIGAELHLPHGLSNALCLPAVAQFNQPAATAKYAQVGRLMGAATPRDSDNEAAQRAVHAIAKLCSDVGIPSGLRKFGAKRERFQELATACAAAGYNRWNPRDTTEDDFLALLEAAF